MIFADTAPAYYAAGVPVIPLYEREKRPVPMDWSQYHDTPVEEGVQQAWLTGNPHGNIGVVLGPQSRMCMLDIDTDDPELLTLIQSLVPDSPWRRVGKKGLVMAFRYSGIRTFRIKTSEGESVCELLSDRTQVVLPPSIHPDTQAPYRANCELLSVIDELPVLDPQIEQILRGAFKEAGVDLSVSGSSRVTDFVSSGSRDTSMTEKAGLFAYAVMRGERSLNEAIGMLRSYSSDFVENVAGDEIDVEKHVENLIKFLHRDVFDKHKQLPEGWDEGLTEEEKDALGLQFEHEHEEWSYGELIDYLKAEFERHPRGSEGRHKAVEKILVRVSNSTQLDSMEESRVVQYIVDTAGLGVKTAAVKARIKELRQTGLMGTDHSEIAQAVLTDMEQMNDIRRHGSDIWKYHGSHWEPVEDEFVLAKIAREYGQLQAARKASDHKGIFATMKNLATVGIRKRELNGVNFANGFLDEKLEMHDHSPDFGMTYTLPFRYLPGQAGNCPLFFQMLEDAWGKDKDYQQKIQALQEALCVTLFGMGPRYQRVVLLQGLGKTGKSELLKIVESLVPDGARSSVPPNDWSDKFLVTQLHGKILNVCGELSEKKKIDGMAFKDIVTGAKRPGQHKGKDIFEFAPNATHWFASNHTPKTDDTSSGFLRRWLILTFNHPVPANKRRIGIGDVVVAEEREAIVAWAVQAMERLLENSEYTLPESHEQLTREVAQENNSVRFFMEESPVVKRVSPSPENETISTSETKLFKEYWSFCFGPGGARPVGLKVFRHRMRELQSELGFELVIRQNAMKNQEALYKYLTIAAETAK